MIPDSLWPFRAAVLAFALALGWAGLLRALRRPHLATLGAGIGLAAGVVLTLGAVPGSPRQLPERLPLLCMAGAGFGLLLALAGARRSVALLGMVLGVLAAAWWLAGTPLTAADLRRGATVLLALAGLLAALVVSLRGPWEAGYAAGLLAAGLWISAPIGPWLLLAVVVLAAVLGGAAGGPAWEAAARLPVAIGLGAVAAGPVLARGGAADWVAAAGPVLALWVAPTLGDRIHAGRGGWVAWAVAAILALLFTWLQSHGP